MPERFRAWLLQLLRVPAEPAPPPGDPRRVRTFRASPRYLHYRIAAWVLKQVSALVGLLVSYFFFRSVVMRGVPLGYFGLIEQIAVLAFIAQLPFSFALLRLDFELRWYILSDRSLRIRAGILSVREQTMTFANVQNISIRQNPLQRLFGIATVVVRAAGGGAASSHAGPASSSARSHEATFEGVDDAEQIRAAIRERVRTHRDAGLGDPDDHAEALEPPAAASPRAIGRAAGAATLRPAIDAAQAVLSEAVALRSLLSGSEAHGGRAP